MRAGVGVWVFGEESAVAFPLAIHLAALPGPGGKLWWQAEKPFFLPRYPALCRRNALLGKAAVASLQMCHGNQPRQQAKCGGSKMRETGVDRPCCLQTVPDKQQRERAGRGLCSSLPGPFAKTTVTWGRSCFNQKQQQGSSGFFQENSESGE